MYLIHFRLDLFGAKSGLFELAGWVGQIKGSGTWQKVLASRSLSSEAGMDGPDFAIRRDHRSTIYACPRFLFLRYCKCYHVRC
ncbi:hypothetical protein E2320_017856 [Naja naja]|nr:hypothetical protein E2320_017856 [Naja naja]